MCLMVSGSGMSVVSGRRRMASPVTTDKPANAMLGIHIIPSLPCGNKKSQMLGNINEMRK